MSTAEERNAPSAQGRLTDTLSELPWWLLILIFMAAIFIYQVYTDETYQAIWDFLKSGIIVTLRVTLIAYSCALVLGLMTGLARVSSNKILYTIATLYVQIMRGLPILVTLMYVAFVFVPALLAVINGLGNWFVQIGLLGPENPLVMVGVQQVSMEARAIFALALCYGAFSSEIFRAGIESIGRGQMEAARSLGMSYLQAMRHIILPQAVRRVMPPLGNDFIAMLKESSLVSALGVPDITQEGKLYAARSFEYIKTYNMVAFLYLTMTIMLSMAVKGMEMRLKTDD